MITLTSDNIKRLSLYSSKLQLWLDFHVKRPGNSLNSLRNIQFGEFFLPFQKTEPMEIWRLAHTQHAWAAQDSNWSHWELLKWWGTFRTPGLRVGQKPGLALLRQAEIYRVYQSCVIVKVVHKYYSVFHRFGQAKCAHSGSFLSASQFLLLPQLPQKMKLASKVVKTDLKIIISLHYSILHKKVSSIPDQIRALVLLKLSHLFQDLRMRLFWELTWHGHYYRSS